MMVVHGYNILLCVPLDNTQRAIQTYNLLILGNQRIHTRRTYQALIGANWYAPLRGLHCGHLWHGALRGGTNFLKRSQHKLLDKIYQSARNEEHRPLYETNSCQNTKYPWLRYSVVCTSKTRSFTTLYKLESANNIWTSSSVQHKKVDI